MIELKLKDILIRGIKICTDKTYRVNVFVELGIYNKVPDEKYLKMLYKVYQGKELDLDNPQDFTEKLQWLKLYNRKDEYTMMVDKYSARQYIAQTIGEQYLIPLIDVWDDPEDIDFSKLPDRFVLKCNHNSGKGMYICKDKKALDERKVKKELKKGLEQDYYITRREWPYKNVKRKIICEQYMEDKQGECLQDYKFFCFNGKPRIMYVSRDAAEKPYTDFFDMDFNHLDITMKDPNATICPEKPLNFEKMKLFSEKLSKGIPFLRVDFYEIDGKLYVGELTFFHNSGFFKVNPEYYNRKLGEWIGKLEKE